MDHRPQAWGRPRDDVYGAYDHSYLSSHHSSSAVPGPKQATQSPVVTGTSVIAIKYKDGVIMAADNLASYGSLARFNDVKRLRPFAGTSVVGFSGDVSDMQYLDRHLNELEIDEAYDNANTNTTSGAVDDDKELANSGLNAANLHKYLSKLFYARRNKFDPLWNQILVAGFDSSSTTSSPFLAAADLRGTVFTSPSLATGYGAMLAQPIMRKHVPDEAAAAKLSKEQAMEVVQECMKVLYYRDARSWDGYSWAAVTREGVEIVTDAKLEKQSWAFADRIKGYGTQDV